MQKHKVFVSFHHADECCKDQFIKLMTQYTDGMVDKSVGDGDIDPGNSTEYTAQQIREKYIADATVTVVLIGPDTWRRKHVDWEISYSLRATNISERSGLIGILLPNHPGYNPNNIPARLKDNLENGFAKIYPWSNDANEIQGWIHEAFIRRNKINPNNSRDLFGNNR
jgi:MTH538 TIR-like domain (DUF1863)